MSINEKIYDEDEICPADAESAGQNLKNFEIFQAINDLDGKVRELEIALNLGTFSEKNQ